MNCAVVVLEGYAASLVVVSANVFVRLDVDNSTAATDCHLPDLALSVFDELVGVSRAGDAVLIGSLDRCIEACAADDEVGAVVGDSRRSNFERVAVVSIERVVRVLDDSVACIEDDSRAATFLAVFEDDSIVALARVDGVACACEDSIVADAADKRRVALLLTDVVADNNQVVAGCATVDYAAFAVREANALLGAVRCVEVDERAADYAVVVEGDFRSAGRRGYADNAVAEEDVAIFLDCMSNAALAVTDVRFLNLDTCAGIRIVVFERDACIGACVGDELVCATVCHVEGDISTCAVAVGTYEDGICTCAAGDVDTVADSLAFFNDDCVAHAIRVSSCAAAERDVLLTLCLVADYCQVAAVAVELEVLRAANERNFLGEGSVAEVERLRFFDRSVAGAVVVVCKDQIRLVEVVFAFSRRRED